MDKPQLSLTHGQLDDGSLTSRSTSQLIGRNQITLPDSRGSCLWTVCLALNSKAWRRSHVMELTANTHPHWIYEADSAFLWKFVLCCPAHCVTCTIIVDIPVLSK